jgi:hypothetical protein
MLHFRRSASVSDDYSVQKTNDDATESKFAAVQVGFNFAILPYYEHCLTHIYVFAILATLLGG